MHTVVTELCSGCDLCVAPCPVDCIEMMPAIGEDALWERPRADAARERFELRLARLERERADRAGRLAQRALEARRSDPEARKKRAIIQAAIERARAKRAAVAPRNTDNLAADAQARIAEVDARRAQIKKAIDDARG
jgi:electron transport complex protein RnfB